MRARRRRLAADDRRRLVDERVILEGFDHEEGEVRAARDVALEDGVADMFAPHREALALAFLEVAAAHDSPAGVAREHPPAGLHLVIEVCESGQPCQRA